MATLKAVILPIKKLKDGTHKIRIAISHNQDTRYIAQDIKIDKVSQFKNGRVVGRSDSALMNAKIKAELEKYQEILDRIDPDLYTTPQIRDFLVANAKPSAVTIKQAGDEHISKLKKATTIDSYSRTLRYFIEAIGDIPMEIITSQTIEDFDEYLYKKKLSNTTRAIHLRQLKAFITPQIERGNIKYKVKPFYDVAIPASAERELDITIEEFKAIRDVELKQKHHHVARDLFCLSFYLGGINLIDLMGVDFKGTDTVSYVREKTSASKKDSKQVVFSIPDEAKPIIKKWMGRNGKLDFGYKFSYNNFRNYVGRRLKEVAELAGIDKRVVFYSARKSFVQHGFELGISLEILEYTIGQSMKENRPIFNYVRIMKDHADKAIRQVLDNLKDDD